MERYTRRMALKTGAAAVGALMTGCHAAKVDGPDGMAVETSSGFKVARGESRTGTHLTMKGVTSNTLDVKISGDDTAGALAVLEQLGQSPHGGPPLHVHPGQDEFFYVVEGRYQFLVGDDRHVVAAGDTIFLPRGVPHAFVQISDRARTLVAYQPAGQMEAFFETTAAWTSPPTQDQVRAVFRAHGMEVVGPALNPV